MGSNKLYITIPGVPITKLRPRFTRFKGKVRTYDAQCDEKETVAWQMKARMKGRQLIEQPIELAIVFHMPIPKHTSGKQRVLMLEGGVRHTKKPDGDNLEKFYWDCMNGTVYVDDRQVYKWRGEKVYSATPRTEITLEWVDDDK